ncbi:MAG: amidohydrolase family protein [Bacilli bacterium]
MRIDAHQHFWAIARGDYGWLTPDMPGLYRDFLPPDLQIHLNRHALDGTILVQAAPTVAETEFLLALSERTETVCGVVGWIDLENSTCLQEFERFSRHPKFVGFRVMIQDMKDPTRILQQGVIARLFEFADRKVPIDLLVKHHQLPIVLKLLEQVPHLRGVIDHLGKPPIASGLVEPWMTEMRNIAQYANLYCKLSGMVTEALPDGTIPDQLIPYAHHVLTVFGPDRVLYGSDWPVCLLAGTYDGVYELAGAVLPKDLTEEDRTNIFGYNAQTFYRLPRSRG